MTINKETMMNFNPVFKLLDLNSAPPHAKEVLRGLLMCQGICKVTLEHFHADPDLQALSELGLVNWDAGCLVVTDEAYEMAEMDPAVA